jgi:hypothetical protein
VSATFDREQIRRILLQAEPLSVLVVGLGQMGRSHALAYHKHAGFNLVGLVNRSTPVLPEDLSGYPLRHDYLKALAELSPRVVSIATHTNTHADMAVAALESGAHVFVENRWLPMLQMRSAWWRQPGPMVGNWSSATSCDIIRPGRG